MLHAPYGTGAKQKGLSLAKVWNPAAFNHAEKDTVDLIIVLGISQGVSVASALYQLNQMLTDGEALKKLRLSYRRSTAMMLVKKFSQELLPESTVSSSGQ